MRLKRLLEFDPAEMALTVSCKTCGSQVVVKNPNVVQCGCGHIFEKSCIEALRSYFEFLHYVRGCDSEFRIAVYEDGEKD